MMYLLQIIDTFTDEILHQEIYDDPGSIESLIESAKELQECYIYDDKNRPLNGSYVWHSIINDGIDTIYKVYFHVRLLAKTRNVYS